MARQSFPYTSYTTLAGDPLSGGYILINIAEDVNSPTGLICQGMTLRADLDQNGNLVSVPSVWPNDQLEPSGSYYVLNAYTAQGELASGPLAVTITTA